MNINSAYTSKIKTDIASEKISDKIVSAVENSIQDGISYAIKNGFYSVVIGINYTKLDTTKFTIIDVYRVIEPQLIELGYTVTVRFAYEDLVGSMVGEFDSVYIYPKSLEDLINNVGNISIADSCEYIDKINTNYILILIEWGI